MTAWIVNPNNVDTREIVNLTVDLTIVGGEIVYDA